jgi:hypothetical protein
MVQPTRRVVILGASNVALSFPMIVETMRALWDEPLEILSAMGHGRSFGQDSSVLGRKIPGIFSCALWQVLQDRPALPTTALITDVGNDLLYGIAPARIVQWVAECVDALKKVGAEIVITELPLVSLSRLGERRFRFFRALFFPRSGLTLEGALAQSAELNERLAELGMLRKVSVIPASGAWYGLDPIHLRRSARRAAWSEILSHWHPDATRKERKRMGVWERAYFSILPPREQRLWGVRRCTQQPSGRLRDGTTIELY